ncbi:amidohydrolase [Bacillus solimangrovi]|uniref:Amidohydrolase n=1 Tax=Bacillus solimangrovi TaxID=1305675 RepID=A0A1E5LCL1_9BACI|nr:amidohydrolase [Bacillus solimangrovi]OEH91815.1 amidohydrolase [Bacillus solimangrovi]
MGTLWHNGTIYTMRNEGEIVEAIYVDGGVIKAIGTVSELEKRFENDYIQKVDLNNHVLYPGFVDSHMHLIGHGEKLLRLDLSEYRTSQKMKKAIMEKVSHAKEGEWIIGEGWNENSLPDRKIFHRTELDEIAPNNPMILKRVCRHALIANSRALEIAGITRETADPNGGAIVRDELGEATGYLLDQAQELVKNVIPPISIQELKRALTVSVKDLHRLGLTGGHTEDLSYYGGFRRTAQSFIDVIDGENIKFRAHLLVHHSVVDDYRAANDIRSMQNEFIEFGAMKIFSDGALGGRTALLSEPYSDAPETSGLSIHSVEALHELFKQARQYKMNVAVHAIGDLAAQYTIEAMEKFPPVAGGRDRLIHGQIMRKDLIDRVKLLPVIFDIQPTFTSSDFPWVVERLGKERMTYSYAWKTLLKEGIHCAGGSDAPIEEVNPLLGIFAAVTRAHPERPELTYGQEQCLTMFEAIQLFTAGSAYAIGLEEQRGKIEVGFDADFTVLNKDLFQIKHEEILETKVELTVVDGTIMYRREELSNKVT